MPPASLTVEDLLVHAAWLRRLAARLVGPAAADDLVQETWIAAMKNPPAPDRPVRPWLATVVRNFARMRVRSEGRRTGREAGVEPASSSPTPEELVARAETQRALAEAVLSLEEPYRQTLLLRYYEGLSAADVARTLGVPAGTVRWRLSEAHERLRLALDRRAGGDRGKWKRALVPLAKGAWIVTRTMKLAAVAAVVLALVALLVVARAGERGGAAPPAMDAGGARAEGTGTGAPLARVGGPVPRDPDTPEPGAPVRLIAAEVVPEPSARNGVIRGRVVNWSSGRGVAGAEVSFASPLGAANVTADADGRFIFAPSAPGRWSLVHAGAERFLPFAPEWGHSPIELVTAPGLAIRDVTLFLIPAVDYTAVVLSPDGTPVAGAEVRVVAGGLDQGFAPLDGRLVTDARGEVVFHAPDDALIEARHPEYGPARGRLDGRAAVSRRVEVRLVAAGQQAGLGTRTLRGRVLGPDGEPVPDALVQASPVDGSGASAPHGQAMTDGTGRFTLAGLDPVDYVVTARDDELGAANRPAPAGGGDVVELRLSPGSVLSGTVSAPGGGPVATFAVAAFRDTGGLVRELVLVRSFVDPAGTFELRGLPAGDYRVAAAAHGHVPSEEMAVTLPRSTRVSLALRAGGTVRGRVVEREGGAPISYARVSVDGAVLGGATTLPVSASTITGDDGAFELSGVPAGTVSLFVAAGEHHMRVLSGLVVRAGETAAPLTIDLARTADGEEPKIELAGIGVQVGADGDAILVQNVFPGGGAQEAGLAAGDRILAVDGERVKDLGMQPAVERIRGPEGSTVRLTVERAGATREVDVPRRRLRT